MSEHSIDYFMAAHAPPPPPSPSPNDIDRRSAFHRVHSAHAAVASATFSNTHIAFSPIQTHREQRHMHTVPAHGISSSTISTCLPSSSLNSGILPTTQTGTQQVPDTLCVLNGSFASKENGHFQHPTTHHEYARGTPELPSKFHQQCSLQRKRPREEDTLYPSGMKRSYFNDLNANSDKHFSLSFDRPSHVKRVRQSGRSPDAPVFNYLLSNYDVSRANLNQSAGTNSRNHSSSDTVSPTSRVPLQNSLSSALKGNATLLPQTSLESPFLLQAQQQPEDVNDRHAPRKRRRCPRSLVDRAPSLFHRPWEAYPTELEKKYRRSSVRHGHSGRRHSKSARRN